MLRSLQGGTTDLPSFFDLHLVISRNFCRPPFRTRREKDGAPSPVIALAIQGLGPRLRSPRREYSADCPFTIQAAE